MIILQLFGFSLFPKLIAKKIASAAQDPVFLINHFAGPVIYTVTSFLEKDKDTFHLDSTNLVASSNLKFLTFLFSKEIKAKNSRQKRGKTILQQFKRSLDDLMSTLESCEPFFIRCIKLGLKTSFMFLTD